MTRNIRATLFAFFISTTLGLLWAGPVSAENLLSLQVGVYSPGSDYPGTAEDGKDFGIFYTRAASRVGFELGMHGYGTKLKGIADISVVGAEMLITFQKPMADVQPYAGLGMGYYSIEIDPAGGGGQTHQDGLGLVAEAGIRVFLEEIFLGLQLKGFTNDGGGNAIMPGDADYGGVSADLILGILF